jgi:hypothetical protein
MKLNLQNLWDTVANLRCKNFQEEAYKLVNAEEKLQNLVNQSS